MTNYICTYDSCFLRAVRAALSEITLSSNKAVRPVPQEHDSYDQLEMEATLLKLLILSMLPSLGCLVLCNPQGCMYSWQ